MTESFTGAVAEPLCVPGPARAAHPREPEAGLEPFLWLTASVWHVTLKPWGLTWAGGAWSPDQHGTLVPVQTAGWGLRNCLQRDNEGLPAPN